MRLSIAETAKRFGVSVRTLHYYDEIGLLSPERKGDGAYRVYGTGDLARLQQILFFRELELPLDEILRILESPDYDASATLKKHRGLLVAKQAHLKELITLVDATMEGKVMKEKKQPSTYERMKAQYRDEVKSRWGSTEAFRESEKKDAARSGAENDALQAEADKIFAGFAALAGSDPASPEALSQAAAWQQHITDHHYRCTKEILSGLAEMYVGDERFKANLDAYGPGTAQFMHDAIKAYCEKA